jgi:hypothetical protein
LGYRDYTDVSHSYELTELTGRDATGISHLHETLPHQLQNGDENEPL